VKETGRAYAKFKVMGMTCASCVNKIEKYIAGKTGVHSIQVALLSELATVEFDENLTDSDILTKDIASLGFDVNLIAVTTRTEFTTVRFKVDLKGAQAVDILKTSLGMVEGIVDVKVSPSDSVVQVEFDPSTVGVRHVLKNIEAVGHDAMLIPSDPTLHFSQKRTLRRSVAFMHMLAFGGRIFFRWSCLCGDYLHNGKTQHR
jgi:Cu+-exporting ATPase